MSFQPDSIRTIRRIIEKLINDVSVGYGFLTDQWEITNDWFGNPRRDDNGNVLWNIKKKSEEHDELRRRRSIAQVNDPFCLDTNKDLADGIANGSYMFDTETRKMWNLTALQLVYVKKAIESVKACSLSHFQSWRSFYFAKYNENSRFMFDGIPLDKSGVTFMDGSFVLGVKIGRKIIRSGKIELLTFYPANLSSATDGLFFDRNGRPIAIICADTEIDSVMIYSDGRWSTYYDKTFHAFKNNDLSLDNTAPQFSKNKCNKV